MIMTSLALFAAAVDITVSGIAFLVLACLVAVGLVVLISFVLGRIRDRRKLADEASDLLRSFGLVLIPAILAAYGHGDIPEAVRKLRELLKLFTDPKAIIRELELAAWKVLEHLLKDPETRAATFDKFTKLVANTEQKPVVLNQAKAAAQLIADAAAPLQTQGS